MLKQTKYSGIIFLVIGIVVGALAFSHFNESSQPKVFSSPAENASASVTPSRDRAVTSLRDLNNAFVDLAEAVSPTVVTVFTEKVTRFRQTQGPFSFFGDPFRDFFGEGNNNQGERRRNTPEREFRQQGLGSGVIVKGDGYILTNNHVVADADSIYIRTIDERTFPAKVIGTDPRTDLAVIKIDARNLTSIMLGNSDQLRVGEWVLAIGSPLSPDLAHSVTQGIVSAKGRSEVGLAEYEDFIQTDAAINPGGALVANVFRNTPADKAGVQEGDVIIAMNGEKIKNSNQLRSEISSKAPGTAIDLQILRDGKDKTVSDSGRASAARQQSRIAGRGQSRTSPAIFGGNFDEQLGGEIRSRTRPQRCCDHRH